MACKNCGKSRSKMETADQKRNNATKIEKTRRGREHGKVIVKN